MSSCRPDHVGPVVDRRATNEPDHCLCCGNDLIFHERLAYWKRQLIVLEIISRAGGNITRKNA